jgi:hypothetical protein
VQIFVQAFFVDLRRNRYKKINQLVDLFKTSSIFAENKPIG